MFPSKDAMRISAGVLKEWRVIADGLRKIDDESLSNSTGEVAYFRRLFPEVERFLNALRLSNNMIGFSCQQKEIHQKPIVKLHGGRNGCELGDCFIVVKYWSNGTLIGKKALIHQFKFSKKAPKWSIDQTQLTLLADWPPFSFGRKASGYNLFSLSPMTPEFGSYWLGHKSRPLSLFLTAHDVQCLQDHKGLKLEQVDQAVRILGSISLLSAIAWRLGEYIPPMSDLERFFDALYRYVEWVPDPPEEFKGFTANERKGSFFAIEINVKSEHRTQ